MHLTVCFAYKNGDSGFMVTVPTHRVCLCSSLLYLSSPSHCSQSFLIPSTLMSVSYIRVPYRTIDDVFRMCATLTSAFRTEENVSLTHQSFNAHSSSERARPLEPLLPRDKKAWSSAGDGSCWVLKRALGVSFPGASIPQQPIPLFGSDILSPRLLSTSVIFPSLGVGGIVRYCVYSWAFSCHLASDFDQLSFNHHSLQSEASLTSNSNVWA